MLTNKHMLVCQICNSIYEKPVIIPCQKTICKSHLCDSSGLLRDSFECIFCKTSHKIPPIKGFSPNYPLQQQVESNIYLSESELKLKFELDKSLKISENTNEKLENAEETMRKYFINIKIKINSHRDHLKSQIDKQAEKTLEKANEIEAKFKQIINSKKAKFYDSEAAKLNLEFEFRKSDVEIVKLENFREELNRKILELDESLKDLIDISLKSCFFEPNSQLKADKLESFGLLYNEFQIITCYTDGLVRIRDLDDFNLKSLKFENVNSMQISLDSQRLIVGEKDHTIRVYCIKTGKLIKNISHPKNDSHFKSLTLQNWKMDLVRCFTNTKNKNEVISGYADSKIVLWDLENEECKKVFLGHYGPVKCLELLNNNLFVSGSSDFSIKIWNLKNGKCLKTLKIHANEICCLKKINELKFASGSADATIRIWSIWSSIEEDTQCIKILYVQKGPVSSLNVNHSLNLLISCSKLIEIWNLDDYTCIKKLIPNENSLPRCLETLANNRIITHNSNKNAKSTIEIWCLCKGESLKVLKDYSCDPKFFQIFPNV